MAPMSLTSSVASAMALKTSVLASGTVAVDAGAG
jgi:hypothetical protein